MSAERIRLRLEVEYDGSELCGFQRQPLIKTVQSELENAIHVYLKQRAGRSGVELSVLPSTSASGRTDSGVHARAQVVSFLWPEALGTEIKEAWHTERLRRALDGITGPEISIKRIEVTRRYFDPRRNVVRKQYRYSILNRPGSPALARKRAWWISSPLDVEAMIAASKHFIGRHDFESFRAGDCAAKNSERVLFVSELVRLSDEEIVYIVQGKGFLKQMVRIIVGTIAEIGKGMKSVADLDSIFEARNRKAAGRTAPAHGLYLDWVRYAEVEETPALDAKRPENGGPDECEAESDKDDLG